MTQRTSKSGARLRTLPSLLLEEYELDPGAIEYLISEASEDGPDGPVVVACEALRRRELKPPERANLAEFVERAAKGDIRTARALTKAAARWGRCPDGEKGWLRSHLATSAPSPAPIPSSATPSGSSARLHLADRRWAIDELPILFDRLGVMPTAPERVEIELGPFVYASAVAVLAEWLVSAALQGRFDLDCPASTQDYLERIRFVAALRNREIEISPDPMDWAVGLTRINRDLPTEQVTDKIVDIIETFINPNTETRSAFQILIAETIENVHRHAAIRDDGFAVAQVYPKKLKMGITFVDGGIGIRRSFETGEPSIPITGFKDDAEFLLAACSLHATSKASGHAGYGLYVLSQAVARNRGTFLIASGRATAIGYLKGGSVHFETIRHRPWHGTVVSVVLDLTRPLPLLDVYRTMPAPKGYGDDELFV